MTIQLSTSNHKPIDNTDNEPNNTSMIVGISVALVVLFIALAISFRNRRKIKEYFRPMAPPFEPQLQTNPTYVEISEGMDYLKRLNNDVDYDVFQPQDDIKIVDENGYVLDTSDVTLNQTDNDIILDEDAYVLENLDKSET
eukprot:m.67992 g.67992  ORF g.67992 m.67992 type:complete len:141 (+) comp11928_c0_seq2:1579-2001(+)